MLTRSLWLFIFLILSTLLCFSAPKNSSACLQVYKTSTSISEFGYHYQFTSNPVHVSDHFYPGRYISAIPTRELLYRTHPETAGRQRDNMWCWAACTQVALNFHGVDFIHQEDIVRKAFGRLVNRPGDLDIIMHSLSGWIVYGSKDNLRYVTEARRVRTNAESIREEFDRFQQPMIAGLRGAGAHGKIGHAVTITGITYDYGDSGRILPRTVVIRDPWPNSPSRQEMSWNEFSRRADWIVKVLFVPN